MSLIKSFVFFLLAIILLQFNFACTEVYSPKINSSEGMLVVDGRISNSPGPYQVKLFRTVAINSTDSIVAEPNAIVTINCDDGNIEILNEIKTGVYETQTENFIGEIGKTYWVEIITSNENKYESIPEIMQGELEIDSLYAEQVKITIDIDNEIDGVNFFYNLKEHQNKSKYYIWDYQESWEFQTIENIPKTDNPEYVCYPTGKSNNINIINASIFDIQNIEKLPVVTLTDRTAKIFYEYYFMVNVYSISEECFLFWDNIKKNSQNSGRLFDAIPANLRGNIQSCEDKTPVLGYFQVSSHTSRGKAFPSDLFELTTGNMPGECTSFPTMEPDPILHHIVSKRTIPNGDVVYTVRPSFCYDCSLKYSPNKPSFWY